MRVIKHAFAVETDWMETMARGLGGTVEGNMFRIPKRVYAGAHYVSKVSADITVMFADIVYHQEVLYQLRNDKRDFVGIYFNLTEGDSAHIQGDSTHRMGRWYFNLAIVDSLLDIDYAVKSGTHTFNLCIFVRRSFLKRYLSRYDVFAQLTEPVFDPTKNTIVRYDRMDNRARHILQDLRKRHASGTLFDIFLHASTYLLLGTCIDQILDRKIVIEKVDNVDLKAIIASQEQLLTLLEEPFPGIPQLADQANMSTTKFKRLYLKITGMSANTFFMDNKLMLARELLDTQNYSISEVADRLQYVNSYYLKKMFETRFGISPKAYTKAL